MQDHHFISSLRQKLLGTLPGEQAQYRMASLKRLEELGLIRQPPDDAKVACVMLLLFQDQDQWQTLLIERTANPHDRHSGQISFPGGRYDQEDPSLEAVAIREAQEEVGVDPAQIEIIGRLTQLYIPVSNFLVHPFIGWVKAVPTFVPQSGEVAHLLPVALDHLSNSAFQKNKSIQLGNGITIPDVPYFEVQERVVWGATAMIISEFQAVLSA